MVSLSRKPKPDPEAMYIAIDSAITPAGTVMYGDRYRGSHPLVSGWPELFVSADLPSAEIRAAVGARQWSYLAAAQPPEQVKTVPLIPPERRVRATTTLAFDHQVVFFAGQLKDSEDPIVKGHAKYFVPDTTA
jgi:hypothetical protein